MRPPLLLLPLLWAGSLAQDDRFRLDVPESVTVQEGLCVTVPCSFSSSWGISSNLLPAYGYWFRAGADTNQDTPVATNDQNQPVQKDTQGRFHLLGDPTTLNCSLSIRDARRSDSGSYVFRVESRCKKTTFSNKFFLHVTGDQGTSRGTGVVLGAVGGAGVTALLAVGLCLIFFIVKTHRKKAAGRAVGVSDSHPADGPACLGHQQEYKLHGLSEPPSSSEASPTLDMEQELHYASLGFHGMTPQGGTSTEYSEIRTH